MKIREMRYHLSESILVTTWLTAETAEIAEINKAISEFPQRFSANSAVKY
jgi:hypothetical protein